MKENKARNILLCVTFIDLLGFGILLPLMPFLALELHANSFEIGCLAASFPLFQMILMPFWGHWADKVGAKPILVISMIGTALSFVLFATSTVFWGLILSRVLAGATSATLGVVRGSLTIPNDKISTQKNMRLFGAAQGMGFLLGPALGALLQAISLRAPIWAAFGICLVTIPFLILQTDLPQGFATVKISFMTKLKKVLAHKELASLSITYFFIYLSFAFLFISFPLFLKQAYAYGARESAIFFSILSVSAVVGQILLLPRLQKRLSNNVILWGALISLAFEIKFLSEPLTGPLTAVILVFTSISLFMALPTLMTEIGLKSNEEEKNFIAAYTESLAGLARFGGTAISGVVIERWSVGRAFDASAGIVVLALVNLYLASKLHQRKS